MFRDIYYGAALYPELWEWEVVRQDICEMKRIGMNVARIGEFAWSTLEPQMDKFDFIILDTTLTELKEQGMSAILCTPTMTPPLWLTESQPNMLHVTEQGLEYGHGSRQHVCSNNAHFRERAEVYAKRLAEFLNGHDNVIAVQLDNEFKAHVGPCYCEGCKKDWHIWLQDKYGTIAHLNEAWNTKIWSQEYSSFEQVVVPKKTAFLHNLSLVEAYSVFTHERINQFAKDQADIIKKISAIPVTHNSSFAFDLDNVGLFGNLDFVSFDTYVDNPTAFAMNSAYWPNMKEGVKEHILMETSTSYPGHIQEYRKLHAKGFVEAESFITFASEGKGFLFWPFRQQRGGVEQPHGSVISAWGEPTIGYEASKRIGELLKKTKDLLQESKAVDPDVAVIYSDQSKSFLNHENGGYLDYRQVLTAYFDHFMQLGKRCSLYNEQNSLEDLKVLCSPYMHYISEDFMEKAIAFVEQGGTWIVGPMSGDRTKEHQWFTEHGLGDLGKFLGISGVIQFPLVNTEIKADFEGKTVCLKNMVTAVKNTNNNRMLGKITEGEQAESLSFIFEGQIGKGKIVFVGADMVDEQGKSLNSLVIQKYCKSVDSERESVQTSKGVLDFIRESNGEKMQHWIVNFSDERSSFSLEKQMYEVLRGTTFEKGLHEAEPYACYVLVEECRK